MLILQLNRTQFEAGRMIKKLHQVPVPHKLYPQRFLLRNKEAKQQQQLKIIALQKER